MADDAAALGGGGGERADAIFPPPRAAYASDPKRSRGRLHPEPESAHRTAFQRDRDRIIHSAAFRRLKHKTQVFVEHEGDYYRTRLTHSIEVAQIARTIARSLGLDEDLAEAVALAHDLGHTPFGHAGEDALAAVMAPYGGFDHNGQALRVVTRMEHRYAEFQGLNLTWETLEGLVKHNGPLCGPRSESGADRPPDVFAAYDARHALELDTFAGPEAQVAALADDVAYNNHDLDDGLRAGLFSFDEARALPMLRPAAEEVVARYPGLSGDRLVFETLRRVFGAMVGDVVSESRTRLAALGARDAAHIRLADGPVIAFSDDMVETKLQPLRRFLFERMYRHERVNRMMRKAKRVVRDLFEALTDDPRLLPGDWRREAEAADRKGQARIVADYIAGMTDRYALDEHRKLFDPHTLA